MDSFASGPLQHRRYKTSRSSKYGFFFIGSVVLVLLLTVPVWNAAVLLQNDVYVYLMGKTWPIVILTLCGSAVALFIVSFAALFFYARQHVQNEHSMSVILCTVVMLLGASFLFISSPFQADALAMSKEIFENCEYGTRTSGLYTSYQVLAKMRAVPLCASMPSVTFCGGYDKVDATDASTLKAMEHQFMCSGFCYSPIALAPAPPSSVSLLQRSREVHLSEARVAAAQDVEAVRMQTGAQPVRALNLASSMAEALTQRTVQHKLSSGSGSPTEKTSSGSSPAPSDGDPSAAAVAPLASLEEYPPLLFSTETHRGSCDGMAARFMKLDVDDMSQQLYFGGVAMIVVFIMMNLTRLCEHCDPRSNKAMQFQMEEDGGDYGSTARRYVMQGVVR